MKFRTIIEDKALDFDLTESSGKLRILHDGKELEADCVALSSNSFSIILHGKSHFLTLTEKDGGYEITVDQCTQFIQVKDETRLLLEKFGFSDSDDRHAGEVKAPIPGLVTSIFVKTGQQVEKNQPLVILEAMKMENEIDSPVAGTVREIHVSDGQSVEKGSLMVTIEP